MPNKFFGSDLSDPKTLAILGMAQGLLQAGGSSPRPINMGEALGMGLQGGMGGFVTGNQLQNQRAQASWLDSMRQQQMEASQASAQQKQDMIKQGLLRQQYLQSLGIGMGGGGGMGGAPTSQPGDIGAGGYPMSPIIPGSPQIGAMPGGNQIPAPSPLMIPTNPGQTNQPRQMSGIQGNMPMLPQGGAQNQGLDQSALIRQLIGSGDPELMAMAKQFADTQPKVKDYKPVMVNGQVRYIPLYDTGEEGTPGSYQAAEKLAFQNFGSHTAALDPFTGQPVQGYQNTMAPGQAAQIAMQREQMNQQQNKPTLQNGQWIYPPNQNNPAGRTVETPEYVPPKGSPKGNAASSTKVLGFLDQAEKLLDKSTGSYAGAAMDMAAGSIGLSTKGAQAASQLKTLQAQIMMAQPRMEGPQSDKDVALYEQMAGQIGDSTVPVQTRRAALNSIKELHQRYSGGVSRGAPESTMSGGGWSAKIMR